MSGRRPHVARGWNDETSAQQLLMQIFLGQRQQEMVFSFMRRVMLGGGEGGKKKKTNELLTSRRHVEQNWLSRVSVLQGSQTQELASVFYTAPA